MKTKIIEARNAAVGNWGRLANAEIQRDEARNQLAETKKNLAYVLTEHGHAWDKVHELENQLAEAQADLLALAEAINIQGCNCGARAESPNTHPHVSGCPTGKALARRGVQWVLAAKE